MGGKLPIDRARDREMNDRSHFKESKETQRRKEASIKRKARAYDDDLDPQTGMKVERADRDRQRSGRGAEPTDEDQVD